MVARTALLCAIEALIVVLLAIQVFAAPSQGVVDTVAPPPAAAPSPAPASAGQQATLQAGAGAPTRDSSAGESQRSEVTAKWRADDPVGVLLTGSLRLRDGSPADASISATLDKVRLGASAAADGTYALVGLQPGEWTISLRGTGAVEVTTTLTITDDAVQHRDFVLDASHPVRVLIVTADGADGTRALRTARSGFADFQVAGQHDRFPENLAPTDYGTVFVGDAKWNAEMNPRDGFAGTLHLAALPAHVALLQRHLVLEQQVVHAGQSEVKFVVDIDALQKLTGSVTVRVLDAATGEPLTKARVAIDRATFGGGGTPVDAEGRALLENLPPGLLRCQISEPDHEMMYTTVRVDVGQRLDLGDVRLGPAAPLKGTVLTADGKPASARLTWAELKWSTAPTRFATNRGAQTDADGTFSLWGTGHGAIAVTARDQEGNLAFGVFDNPPAAPVVLYLAKPCDCTVSQPADPTRAFVVTIYDAARRPITAWQVQARMSETTRQLPAGEYTFEVHDDQDRLVQSGALTLGTTPCRVEIR